MQVDVDAALGADEGFFFLPPFPSRAGSRRIEKVGR